MTPTQYPSMASQATAELPKLPQAHSDPRTAMTSYTGDDMFAYGRKCYEAGRAAIEADRLRASYASAPEWQPIEMAPKAPNKRILLRWLSGQSNWICIGAWASSEDSPRLKVSGCPREGWMPDAGTCIPTNQKDCIGWQPLPSAPATLGETK